MVEPGWGGAGSGATTVVCDNSKHQYAVTVTPGPWQLGQRQAQATGCCFTCSTDVRQIRIVS